MTDQRAEAIALAAEVGAAEAARELGLNSATLRSWIHRASVRADGAITVVRRSRPAALPVEVGTQVPTSPTTAGTWVPAPSAVVERAVVELPPARRRPWPERATEVGYELVEGAAEAVTAMRRATALDRAQSAEYFARVVDRVVGVLQLISGEATQRTESSSRSMHVVLDETTLAHKTAAIARERAKLRGELEGAIVEAPGAETAMAIESVTDVTPPTVVLDERAKLRGELGAGE